MVSLPAGSRPDKRGLHSVRSQLSGMIMENSSRKLFEEAQVAVEEQAQVPDAVAQHGEALETRTEGEADEFLRIEAEIPHHLGMDLARARDLEPAAVQLHVDFSRRLGEGKVGRPEAHFELFVLEEALQELGVDALEVGEADVPSSHRPSTRWNIGEVVGAGTPG